jgi:DNA-binding MarR family transcriptional regulator
MSDSNKDAGRFSYDGLERDLHERARLGILTSLVGNADGLLFTELKDLCSLTDGNLNRHIGKLKETGMVEVWKGFKDNKPQTLCRITKAGRARFMEYIAVLERVVEDAAAAEKDKKKKPLKGWTPA